MSIATARASEREAQSFGGDCDHSTSNEASVTCLQPMEALALYDATRTLVDMLDAMLCQPRFVDDLTLNPAGDTLSRLREQISDLAETAMAQAARRAPQSRLDRLHWAEARLRHAAEGADDIASLIAFDQSLADPRN